MYQKGASIVKDSSEIWENIVYPRIKQKIEYTNSFCEMILGDLTKVEEKVDQVKERMAKSDKDTEEIRVIAHVKICLIISHHRTMHCRGLIDKCQSNNPLN